MVSELVVYRIVGKKCGLFKRQVTSEWQHSTVDPNGSHKCAVKAACKSASNELYTRSLAQTIRKRQSKYYDSCFSRPANFLKFYNSSNNDNKIEVVQNRKPIIIHANDNEAEEHDNYFKR